MKIVHNNTLIFRAFSLSFFFLVIRLWTLGFEMCCLFLSRPYRKRSAKVLRSFASVRRLLAKVLRYIAKEMHLFVGVLRLIAKILLYKSCVLLGKKLFIRENIFNFGIYRNRVLYKNTVLNILRFWNFSDKVEFICDESLEGKLSFLLSYLV